MSVYYGNQTGTISQQVLRVDSGAWSFISYPPTLNWLFRSHEDVYLNLAAGTHTITFGVSDPSIGTAKGQVTMDDVQLTYAPGAIPGVTGPGTTYPAAYADLSGRASTVPCDGPGCLAAQDVVLGSGGSASFEVDAGTDGSTWHAGGRCRARRFRTTQCADRRPCLGLPRHRLPARGDQPGDIHGHRDAGRAVRDTG